ncbi:MAG: hypothetical protein LBS31_03595, partial [Candidatus Adiutrix sp.]|nr:hypothetical protein [Candidatus Adiutrix sp.]
GEVLDFLSILPYAADGCVFVLHDLNLEIPDRLLRAERRNSNQTYCCKQLFSAVKAEKFYPAALPEADFYDETSLFYLKHLANIALPNIGAFRAGPETAEESALRDVFSLLPTVWTRQLDYPAFVRLSKRLRKHYPGRLVDIFEIAYNFNRLMHHGVKLETP